MSRREAELAAWVEWSQRTDVAQDVPHAWFDSRSAQPCIGLKSTPCLTARYSSILVFVRDLATRK